MSQRRIIAIDGLDEDELLQWNVSPAVLKRLAQEERKPSSEAAGTGKVAPLSLVTVPKKQ
jgi:DNA primase